MPPPMVPTSMEGIVIVINKSWEPLILEEREQKVSKGVIVRRKKKKKKLTVPSTSYNSNSPHSEQGPDR